MRLQAAALAVLALGQPPIGHPPAHTPPGMRNVARGCLVYARPGTYFAPGAGDPQAGLQRLTDGVLAGRAPLVSRETLLIAPYTADLPELPLASVPATIRAGLATATGYLEVDLGGEFAIEALALEADASADYQLESSREGRFWHSLWTAPAAFGQHGWVLRTSGLLAQPREARFVRVSGAAGYGLADRPDTFPGESRRLVYAVTELEVFSRQVRPRTNTILPGMDLP